MRRESNLTGLQQLLWLLACATHFSAPSLMAKMQFQSKHDGYTLICGGTTAVWYKGNSALGHLVWLATSLTTCQSYTLRITQSTAFCSFFFFEVRAVLLTAQIMLWSTHHYAKQREALTMRTRCLLDFPWWLPAHDSLFMFVPPDSDARKRTTWARKPIKIIAFTTHPSVWSWKDHYLQVNRLRHTSSGLVPA